MSLFSTGDQTLLREINLSSVLRYIHSNAPISRTQLAAVTGLNKSTVSSLIDELTERGLVCQTGTETSGIGRPASLLELNPEAGCIIGVEYGVDFALVILANFGGEVIWRSQEAADPSEGQVAMTAKVFKLVDQAIDVCNIRQLRLLGLGIATPGTVQVDDGFLVYAPNLNWRDVAFAKIYSERYPNLRVYVDNDANTAATGEHLFGVAQRNQDFIFLFSGVGIGAGLFLNGGLYRGQNGFAGEIGHSTFMTETIQRSCQCGKRGCWETYANQSSIIDRIRVQLQEERSSMLGNLFLDQSTPISMREIQQAAESGDAVTMEALNETGQAMGVGVANIINIFNPSLVVIGGLISSVAQFMLPGIMESMVHHTLPEFHQKVQVKLSAFGSDSSVIGAVATVVEAIFSKPTRSERVVL
jgi:predicted NBD/HSP70 family sugar kinase